MTTYAINANTGAVSTYTGEIRAVALMQGATVLAMSTGLYEQTGPCDAAAYIETGELDLLGEGSLALNLARVDLVAGGTMHLTATAHQDGGERSAVYLIPKRDGEHPQDRVVRLGSGMMGNTWSFQLESPAGGDWGVSRWTIETGRTKLRYS